MRCIHCKEKFEQYEFNNKHCKEEECQVAKAMYNLDKIKKKEDKEWKEWKKRKSKLRPKVYAKEYKGELQREVNKLARNIDAYFNLRCIDCDKPFGKQVDGAHFHNVGGNENIRFNLHNIHSAKSNCNQFDSEHKKRYPEGLKKRYGGEYLEYVQYALRNDYKVLKLTEQGIYDKLKTVRKLNREFHTFTLTDPKSARTYFNKLIGIYLE